MGVIVLIELTVILTLTPSFSSVRSFCNSKSASGAFVLTTRNPSDPMWISVSLTTRVVFFIGFWLGVYYYYYFVKLWEICYSVDMIYTKKGDGGTTGLFGTKRRVSKSSNLIRAIGAVDEANSYLGVVISKSPQPQGETLRLRKIQADLFVVGSILAGSTSPIGLRRIKDRVVELESEIDKMEGELPLQKNFIIPGGCELSAHLFFARALVRRAEREVVGLSVLPYLNRLSDYLFILARWVNFKNREKEISWKK